MDYRLLKALLGTFLLLVARNACAQNLYYPDSVTIDTGVGTGNPAWAIIVGYDNDMDYMNQTNGTSPTVTMVDGAYVTSEMSAQNGSTIDVEGGYANALGAAGSATINLNGGDVSSMGAAGNAMLNISGGTMDYGAFTLDSSTLIMNGGEVGTYNKVDPSYPYGAVTIEDQSTALLDGGTIDSSLGISGFGQAMADNMTIVGAVQTTDFASFTMTGGSIGSLSMNSQSTATVTGGTIVGLMASYSGQTSTASDTTIGNVVGFAGTISLSGTTITGSVDCESGVINVSGGTIGGNATSFTSSATAPAIQLSLDGGVTVTGLVAAYNVGAIAIYNATVTGDVEAHQKGVVGMSNGTLNGGVNTYDSGSFILNGGTVNGDVNEYNASTISVNGGMITGTLSDNGDQNFSVVGLNITAGTIANVSTNSGHQETMSGGTIQNNLTTYSNGVFTLTGGSVNGTATGYDFSTVRINGGAITNIVAHDYSNFDLITGSVNGSIQVHDLASVNISGGNVYGSLTEDGYGGSSLSGGQIGNDAALSNGSSLSISGAGAIGGNVTAHDFSDINMSGGTITGNVDFYDNSGFRWSGGHIQGVISMHDDSFLQWTGGTFGSNDTGPHIIASADSPADTSTPIYVYDDATIEIDGIHLSSTLVNANTNGFSLYSISGNLGDGSALTSDIQLYIQNPTGSTTGGSLQLGHAQQQWIASTGGSWATAANWLANLVPDEAGAPVIFTDTQYVNNPVDEHVALNGSYMLGSLTFSTANNIILDPGTSGSLILNNPGSDATITVTAAHPQINVPLILESNTTISVGQLDEGTVRIARSSAITPSISGDFISLTLNTGLTIPAGMTVTKTALSPLFTTFVHGGNLDIEEGAIQILPNGTPAATSRIAGLNITYEGQLDLTNNDLIIDYTAGNSPLGTIQEYLAAGYDGGYWNGSGISSSIAGGNPNFSTTLGYADNSVLGLTSFDGQSIGSNVILIKYTWVGDANLDGVVDNADLLAMSSAGTTWATGDFNYDGVVNADDYALFMLGAAYGSSTNISATLPEPGVGVLLVCGSSLLTTGRRRRVVGIRSK